MADTVAVMNEGRVEQLGPPAEIYEFPATPFVANFLGKSNLLAGRVVGAAGDDVAVEVAGGRFALPATRSRAVGDSVFLGVRPEKAQMAARPDAVPQGHNRVAGAITDTCYSGVSTEYLIRTAWGQELSVFSSNATADGPLPPGTEVVVHWRPAHSFLLDRADEAGAVPDTGAAEPAVPEEVGAAS